ncbi:MAG: PEP-CTERM sorting domain-containing protein [Nitrospirae bacterium]|nr:PEP-CTERM sorting domain-containing protein [Nitrospirota bacterium]MBI4849259.1 PEP-CTERM sorting domain-containing protein [Nitrospirota bacterium]
MDKHFKICGILVISLILLPVLSFGKPISFGNHSSYGGSHNNNDSHNNNSCCNGGPHLWLSTDPATFDEGGTGYIGNVGDSWLNDSYVTVNNPFDLYIYNASKSKKATDIQLLIAIHAGESGTVTVDGTDYSLFTGTTLPSQYGGGNHGVYDDPSGTHDGRYVIANLGFDLNPKRSNSASISWTGFSEVHFDVFSSNCFWNPPSHDATSQGGTPVPEPGTLLLLGSGLLGLGIYSRRGLKK